MIAVRACIVSILTFLGAADAVAQRSPAVLRGIDAYAARALADWNIAGLAVAVVHGNSVVYARGFGLKRVGNADPVTERTVFAIGSNTKLFTAVLAGMLVDQGRMRWNAPLIDHLPEFRLFDPRVTRELTLIDALSHRSGLGQRGEMVAYGTSRSRAQVLQQLRFLQPNSSFRSGFGYSNAMFLAAGEAEAVASGMSWDSLIVRRIFTPLGMSASTTSIEALSQLRDVATPHTTGDSGPVPIPWRNIDNIAPAGSINSSALDMARWLKFLLAGGRHDGRPLLSDSSMRMITSPHTMMPHSRDTLRPSIHFLAYGLGVMTYDYRGVKVLSHGGGIDGMLSDVTWIPERDFGVVVLANTDGNNLAQVALTRWIVDRMLGAPEVDWSSVLLNDIRRYQRDMTLLRVRLDSLRPRNTSPGVDLERYTGRFEHPLYGAIEIADADALTLRLVGGPGGTLSHWAHDTFLLQWESAGPALRPAHVTFDIDPTGRVEALTIRDDLLAPPGERVWERDRFTREKGSP